MFFQGSVGWRPSHALIKVLYMNTTTIRARVSYQVRVIIIRLLEYPAGRKLVREWVNPGSARDTTVLDLNL